MGQFITSTEACALLDQILNTIQHLTKTRASLAGVPSVTGAEPAKVEPMVQAELVREPIAVKVPERAKSSVLTITLADLVREGSAARERRNQHVRPQRPQKPRAVPQLAPQRLPPLREVRTIEVLYKRQRLAS